MKRLLIYLLVIPLGFAAIVVAADRWQEKTQQRSFLASYFAPYLVRHYLKQLGDRNAILGDEAYWQLNDLYFRRWSAVPEVIAHVHDERPIHFLIEEDKMPVPGAAAKTTFVSSRKPIFYKAERVPCRTVGEAIRSILYREYVWKKDFEGDWNAWWDMNKIYYPR